ncbi:Hypothetical protein D9617_45g091340 [Elsinoe fawcettii]|nr:Hypothetical protein D9617_45g091340 [Elsinoe fawcettii]
MFTWRGTMRILSSSLDKSGFVVLQFEEADNAGLASTDGEIDDSEDENAPENEHIP